MAKSAIFWAFITIMLGYIGKYLIDIGVFRQIEPYGLDRCRLMRPSDGEGQAFEDMAVDADKGIAYLPGDDRTWWSSFNLSVEDNKKQGNVFLFDILSEKFKKMNLIQYPYEHFHPLGIGLLKGKANQLFMTNYRTDKGHILGSVEIFQVDVSQGNQLTWIDSVVHPLFTAPDDVLAIDENTFYVTNVYHYRKDHSHFMHTFEVLTKRPWTNLLLCSKTDQWQCSVVIDSIIVANGLAASLDFKTIYMAASSEKRIRVYERDPTNNALTYIHSIFVPFLIDNIIVNENDQLIAAGHPNGISFLLHEKNPREKRAPSEVILIPHPKSNSTFKHLLLTNGELLSGSTVGATYQNTFLVGALFDSGILFCHDLN